ncbi:MAG: MoxR family ATPase [Lachnospiraceae bacterium]|nr:MoxR family ATPase [Lachnospiraceae bacterium]MBR6485198.1 MoxR family ATPase [Lachnospiraceae bacterium]
MNNGLNAVKEEIKKVLRGKDDVIEMVLCTLLASGHILLEDIPGVGKTTLAVALSRSLGIGYKRMQFTPDVLPSDILGFSMYDREKNDFTFKPGAVFTNLFLADEINRTSPKTQAALLEVMEERKVTVESTTYKLKPPFFVIATQNPIGASGTQKLPDSQLDRFFVRLTLGYPDHTAAAEILKGHSFESVGSVNKVLSAEELLSLQETAANIYASDEICDYIVSLCEATRNTDMLIQGISPRGSIALLKLARAYACLCGRDFVIPEDIHKVIHPVCNHRIILSTKAKAAGRSAQDIINDTLSFVTAPL